MSAFQTFLSGLSGPVYAIFRIITGLLFMSHGTQKLLGFPSEFTFGLNPMSIAAGGIELVGGFLIVIGLFTRPTAFISSGMCAVGYWLAHGFNSFFPIDNGGEVIALYCFIFLVIATQGPGIWSFDSALKSKDKV
ncbi:DoxX family protein [Hellea balneolensis]|uniref:DoxX family protein n=1 Tax=Hellea balneolensis TaxID=287478 RepID=UPI000422DDBC|nr:DoxX family protein [Hellea balneolensis]